MADFGPFEPGRIIYRWDLDKTYLRTEFDTVRDLLRTAVEPPQKKRTVPGAAALLRELRATRPRAITILSGSPEQMRQVLEAKLRLDGIVWDGFTLKPSLENLLRGRFRFLRDQVSYKLRALLSARIDAPQETEEVLFGDDAEADAYIYSLYADIAAGRVDTATLLEVLRRANVYSEDVPEFVRLASRIPRHEVVRRIFIHLDRISPAYLFDEFGPRVTAFYNYFQPALVLLEDGATTAEAALRVGAHIVIEQGMNPDALVASYVDLARRGQLGTKAAERIFEVAGKKDLAIQATAGRVLGRFASELERELPKLGARPAPAERPLDFVGLFDRDRERARAAKLRALWRRPG